MAEPVKVGFIGLGNQGGPIARHIIQGGFATTLWARRPEALEPFVALGASTAATAAELASCVDLVGICTWDDTSVLDVMHGPEGVLAGARPGTVVAIHATVHPELCVELAEEALPKGVIVIDVPVSGGPEQSEEGTLLVMMGGETEVVERFRPVFDTFGTPVLHLGLVGAGQLAKLVNNTLLTANLGLAANAIEVGKRVGIDPDTLVQVITNGSGRSYGGGIFERNRLQPGTARGTLAYLDKDVHLLVDTVRARGADPTSTLVDVAEAGLAELRIMKAAAEEAASEG